MFSYLEQNPGWEGETEASRETESSAFDDLQCHKESVSKNHRPELKWSPLALSSVQECFFKAGGADKQPWTLKLSMEVRIHCSLTRHCGEWDMH